MKTWKRTLFAATLVAGGLLVVGCKDGNLKDKEWGSGGPGANGPGALDPASVNPTAQCAEMAQKYVGFGKSDLLSDRVDAVAGVNRQRFKPYSALTAEYPRVTKMAAPALLGQSGSTFGQPLARWNQEPEGSAVNLYTAFRIAFESCLTLTATSDKYAAAPTDASAGGECAAFARSFWSRTANPDEIKACVQVATVDSTKETDVRRRWAYTCASVLSAAGFLTY